ncbi:DUF445 family protein [Paenibacillus sp. SC116]|uniref:DUF445 family protein n=1 Tax=Paenibacillus sp. SC116 TaxID=2968986 RepID=UPI00215A3FFC|nr:DUF445 family protein [Paenibacillus sp. SC116]MCR8843677.1 DUF445 family protein [Paenibacillus sp. SC116]
MQAWLLIIFSIAVAAIVGGVTNHFAIKMLFHPRRPIYIGSWKLPFTPGLIPKRKQDIAESLGEVVAQYLVTSDGLRSVLEKPGMQQQLTQTLTANIDRLATNPKTLMEWIHPDAGEEDRAVLLQEWEQKLRMIAQQGIAHLWQSERWSERSLHELLPGLPSEVRSRAADKAAQALLNAVSSQIQSFEGQRMLANMLSKVLDRSQGFFGTMAAIFVDEDKLVSRMIPLLAEQLKSSDVRRTVARIVERKLDEWMDKTPAELVQELSGETENDKPELWVAERLNDVIPFAHLAQRLADLRPADWIQGYRQVWEPFIPRIVQFGVNKLDQHLDQLIKSIGLEDVVRAQVEKFPIERLEHILLSVSGKEFRAITWLGVLLGGIIGGVQALVLLAAG